MLKFNKADFLMLEDLLKMTQEELHAEMTKVLSSVYQKRMVSTKHFIIAFGDIPVALCAHMDTIFEHTPTEIFWDQEQQVVFGNYGLGADDRAGIFAIMNLLSAGYRPTIILTTDEESGNIGAQVLTRLISKAPIELKYIIQLDRRGKKDCVFYDCWNEEFMDYVINFGFDISFGSYSDISSICPAWDVAGVNLSIGYKDEHTFRERLYVNYMIETIEKVKKMLNDANNVGVFKYMGDHLNEY